MNKKIMNMVITTIALGGMLCATTVFAFPIVTDWSYTIDSGFMSWTNCNGQVKQDTLLSRLFIKFPLILDRGLIA